jgi:hypothetical protein
MMLDTPAVRNNNPAVDAYFTNNAGNDVKIQNQIYLASRQRRAQFYPFGYHPGTDPVVFSYTINAYDGIANGPALPGGVAHGANTNGHAYGWYGFLPNIYAADQASRTVAYALKNYSVPATVAVGHGAHWVVVDGVQTVGDIPTPANPNSQFNILGFRVSDPWTGYAKAHNEPVKGLGQKAWYRYGFNANANGYTRPGAWYNFFNPINPGPYPFSGQFNIVIEPDPEPPFPADAEEYSSQPTPYAILASAVTAGDALSYALGGLAGDFSFLDSEFSGGNWDTGNVSFFSFPTDPAGVGDWMIPYVDVGDPANVLGAVMVDSLSGAINQAMWFEDDLSFSFQDLNEYYGSLYALDIPLTAVPVPEPLSSILLVLAVAWFWLQQRRHVRSR